MTKSKITEYDNTATNNTDVEDVPLGENLMYPSHVNNAFREIMADLADVNDGTVSLTSPSFAAASLTGNLSFGDNDKAIFGADSDMSLFHNGNNAFLDNDTGSLFIQTDGFSVKNATGTESMMLGAADGAVTLYHNNSAKLASTATGIDVTGTVTADGLTVDDTTNGGLGHIRGLDASLWLDITAGNNAKVYYDSGDLEIRSDNPASSTKRMLIANNGDISFYEDTGTTAKLFWDASAERLGLGTTSPSATLHVAGGNSNQFIIGQNTLVSGGSSRLQLVNTSDTSGTAGTAQGFQIINNGNDGIVNILNYKSTPMAFWTSGSERMRIDSSGRVGIGTNSPAAKIDVVSSGANLGRFTATNGYIDLVDPAVTGRLQVSGNVFYMGTTASGDMLAFKTGANTERMRIDSSGRLQVGTTSAINDGVISALGSGRQAITAKVTNNANSIFQGFNSSGTAVIQAIGNGNLFLKAPTGNHTLQLEASVGTSTINFVTSNGTVNTKIRSGLGGAANLSFDTAGSERMRISSAGDVLISTTNNIVANSSTSSGTSIGSGLLESARAGVVAQFNRQTSDGSVIDIQKSGTTVGSIGVNNANNTFIGSTATAHTGLEFGDDILPRKGSNTADNQTNLGSSSIRFKDLHLGGVSYISDGTSSGTQTVVGGNYYIANSGAYPIVFQTNSAERMRIDSSGNLLVGRTSTSTSVAGVTIPASGAIQATANFNPLGLNRLSGDGNIAVFQKSGTTVGSIGVASGDLNINGGASHSGIRFQATGLYPLENGTTSSGEIDLGAAGSKFKNLYLHSTAYAGGLSVSAASGAAISVANTGTVASVLMSVDSSVNSIYSRGVNSSTARDIRFMMGSTERMRVNSSGKVLIGRTTSTLGGGNGSDLQIGSGTSSAGLTIHTSTSGLGDIQFADGTTGADSYRGLLRYNHSSNHMSIYTNGTEAARLESDADLHVNGNVVAYSTTISDIRLKKDIAPIEDAVTKVQQLNGCTFTYLKDDRQSAGLIAQDVEKVLPSAVIEDKAVFHGEEGETYKTVQYDQLIGLLVEAVKELKAEIEELKNGTAK